MRYFFSSRRRHTRFDCDWSSDVCSSDLARAVNRGASLDRRVSEAHVNGGKSLGLRDLDQRLFGQLQQRNEGHHQHSAAFFGLKEFRSEEHTSELQSQSNLV